MLLINLMACLLCSSTASLHVLVVQVSVVNPRGNIKKPSVALLWVLLSNVLAD